MLFSSFVPSVSLCGLCGFPKSILEISKISGVLVTATRYQRPIISASDEALLSGTTENIRTRKILTFGGLSDISRESVPKLRQIDRQYNHSAFVLENFYPDSVFLLPFLSRTHASRTNDTNVFHFSIRAIHLFVPFVIPKHSIPHRQESSMRCLYSRIVKEPKLHAYGRDILK